MYTVKIVKVFFCGLEADVKMDRLVALLCQQLLFGVMLKGTVNGSLGSSLV